MNKIWWKEAVVYQVYWRSFFDSNGDGIGDIQGLISKLDYINNLGVDVIWLNPCFQSPDVDNGYDISDYKKIMGKAGTMNDFEMLLNEVHKRGMKLIMDLVVNHTSDQHPWFLEAKKGRDNPKRDYYIWSDQPNNWRSYFTPSTWEYDETSGQYYFHSFATEQPDLNWSNLELREEVYSMMRWWLEKGIDGFRLDAIALLAKKEGFQDAVNPDDISYLGNQPGIHEYLQEMHQKVLKDFDVLTVGEVAFVEAHDGVLYVDEERKELHTLFHFEVCDYMKTWEMKRFKEIQKKWYESLWNKGWNSQFLNNHDHTRLVTRFGNDREYRVQSAKLFGLLLHTLPGTPYIYQGEEIGMTGVRFPSVDDYQDIAFRNKFKEETEKNRDPKLVFEELLPLARDNSRTPMQWSDDANAGFTTGQPWMKVNPNYNEINVEKSLNDQDSIYYFYKKMIRMRKQFQAMVYGTYHPFYEEHEQLYVFTREYDNMKLLVILNISAEQVAFCAPEEVSGLEAELLLSNYEANDSWKEFKMKPYEARLYLLK